MAQNSTAEMLLGALVSDAACLGLHWLYDPERIAQIASERGGASAFTPVDPANFEGVPGYFAHGARRSGMLTQYGEVLRLSIQSLNANKGVFDLGQYQEAFAAHFGPGGAYRGYIDRPTRGALDNIAAGLSPTGIDDDQNPAIANLPAVLAAYDRRQERDEILSASMRVTNVNDVAQAYRDAFANLLSRVLGGATVADALSAAASGASPLAQAELAEALATAETDTVVYAGQVGRACHLPTSGPVMFHVLKHSGDVREAVERNILAGGDSAGRSILIGAVMGAAHGVEGPNGIPMEWVLMLEEGRQIWKECLKLAEYSKDHT